MAAGRPAAEPERCFVALRPDEPARARLAALAGAWRRACPGSRAMRAEDLHLTLAFIGALEAALAARVAARLAAMVFAPFDWSIDRRGGFAQVRVAWAGGPPNAPLAALAEQVRGELDALGVRYDHRPFAAHVTLLRSARQAPAGPLAAPIAWRVDRPVLLVSRPAAPGGPRYRSWPGT